MLPGKRNGDTSFPEQRIRIREGLAPAARAKILCHELAHVVFYDGFAGEREQAECEAESVAFVVCAELGLDSSAYSFGYIAGWVGSGDDAIKAITTSGNRIQRAVRAILGSVVEPEVLGLSISQCWATDTTVASPCSKIHEVSTHPPVVIDAHLFSHGAVANFKRRPRGGSS